MPKRSSSHPPTPAPFLPEQKARRAGRYLLLEVPNEQHVGDEAKQLTTSFLRLGASPLHYKTELPTSTVQLVDMFPKDAEFFDDRRTRDGGPDFRPEADRIADTEKMFTRGGWWDHSGGNRISTTEGDKLEVIRGNYRLAVLGRQKPGEESWGESAGFDFSGGVIRDKQRLPGEIYSVEWVEKWGGTWRVTEETKRGDIREEFWGNRKSHNYGDTFKDVTGSDDPSDEEPNPDITSKTWAGTITANTGSASKPVDSSTDETWALDIKSNLFTLAKSGTTQALSMQEATHAGAITESTAYALKNALTIGGTKNEISLIASETDISVIGAKQALSLSATALDVEMVPAKVSVAMGGRVGVSVGDSLELGLGNSVGVKIGDKIDVALNPVAVEAEFAATKLSVFLGIALTIKLIAIDIEPDKEDCDIFKGTKMGKYLKMN